MNAREQIVRVLEEVFEQGAYSNIALNQALEHSQLSDKDRSFVTEVVYGTVARKITLEWYLAHVIEDRTKLDPWLYYLLMMSLYQLVYLDRIPDHAIVNEAVRIAKRRKEGSEKFVNAILRKLIREGLPAIDTIKRKNKRYSVEYSLPVWLVKALIEEYGKDIFEREMEANEKEFLSTVINSRVRIMHIKRNQKIKYFDGNESVLYILKLSLLYRRILLEILGVEKQVYVDKLRKCVSRLNRWNDTLDKFLLRL